jgi:hypothetical protein
LVLKYTIWQPREGARWEFVWGNSLRFSKMLLLLPSVLTTRLFSAEFSTFYVISFYLLLRHC